MPCHIVLRPFGNPALSNRVGVRCKGAAVTNTVPCMLRMPKGSVGGQPRYNSGRDASDCTRGPRCAPSPLRLSLFRPPSLLTISLGQLLVTAKRQGQGNGQRHQASSFPVWAL